MLRSTQKLRSTHVRAAGAALVAALCCCAVVAAAAFTGSARAATSATVQNIPETLAADGNFKTLAGLLKTSGLDKMLAGKGPFTIFAPTDAAFAALPKGALEALEANPQALRALLLYHVVPGDVSTTTPKTRSSITTLEGKKVGLSLAGTTLYVNNAGVIASPATVSNGIIQQIGIVLAVPTAPKENASNAGYCAVAGNTWPSGQPVRVGRFLELDLGQPKWDFHYAGAVPANFVEGKGLTCHAAPAGFTAQGTAPGSLHVPANLYPYFVKKS